MGETATTVKPRSYYNCVECPAFCCSVYERVQVTPRDIRRLAKHFGVTAEVATARYTKMYEKERVLRRKRDALFGEACQFINPETRGCTIYNARPAGRSQYAAPREDHVSKREEVNGRFLIEADRQEARRLLRWCVEFARRRAQG